MDRNTKGSWFNHTQALFQNETDSYDKKIYDLNFEKASQNGEGAGNEIRSLV